MELLIHKQDVLMRTLQNIQPWINILRTWGTLSSQQQHVSIADMIMLLGHPISIPYPVSVKTDL